MKKVPAYSAGLSERLRAINFNLLPILRELLRYKKVGQAALALNMSQSAVSDALSRLRHIFQDDLLIPQGRTFVLSEKAREIESLNAAALAHLEALLGTTPFDPQHAVGRIQISSPDSLVLTLGMRLVGSARSRGAMIAIQFHGSREGDIQSVATGMIDFALILSYGTPEVAENLRVTRLFDETLVLLAAGSQNKRGLMIQAPTEMQRFVSAETGFGEKVILDESFLQATAESDLQIVVNPSLRLLPAIAESQNTFVVVPRRLAQRLAQGKAFRVIECVLPPVAAFVVWNRARINDALHQWMLSIMLEIGAALTLESTSSLDPL